MVEAPSSIPLGSEESPMALEQELATFDRELPQLLQTMRGQLVLIHGEETSGPYKSEDDAYVAGCEKYGVEPFLVMLVEENERPIPLLQDVSAHAGPQRPA
jgi:hypothetical protein